MAWILLYNILGLFKWLIIIRALLSWFVSPYSQHTLVKLLRRLTDPILRPVSEMVPSTAGVDISPLVAIFALYLLQMLVMRLAVSY